MYHASANAAPFSEDHCLGELVYQYLLVTTGVVKSVNVPACTRHTVCLCLEQEWSPAPSSKKKPLKESGVLSASSMDLSTAASTPSADTPARFTVTSLPRIIVVKV